MKSKKIKILIAFLIFILFICIASSCSKKNKVKSSDNASIENNENEEDNTNDDNNDIDSSDEIDESDNENTSATKSINDYPDFLSIIDNSNPASKFNISKSIKTTPKSLGISDKYYYVLQNDSIYVYSKNTGNNLYSLSLDFVNKDYDEKKDTEKNRDYNKDKITSIAVSEENLWVCHSSNKTSTITKFRLSNSDTNKKLSSDCSFTLKKKCNFISYNNGIIWTGQTKKYNSDLYGYSVKDNNKNIYNTTPKYDYHINIPERTVSIAANGNQFFICCTKHSYEDSFIYVFNDIDLKNADLTKLDSASKVITAPPSAACITYYENRLITLFKNKLYVDHACPLIIN